MHTLHMQPGSMLTLALTTQYHAKSQPTIDAFDEIEAVSALLNSTE